jgi:hypothetical protein
MSRKPRRCRQQPERRHVRVITEAEAGFPHAVAMREGARKILRDYADPPEGGTLVPRGWVEEHMDELRVTAELACGKPIPFLTPGGNLGSERCDLLPGHEGDCDSPNLFLRPADALKIVPGWL